MPNALAIKQIELYFLNMHVCWLHCVMVSLVEQCVSYVPKAQGGQLFSIKKKAASLNIHNTHNSMYCVYCVCCTTKVKAMQITQLYS